MRYYLYKVLSYLVKIFSQSDIVSKPVKGFPSSLYYEKSQHLTFLFKRTIDYENKIWNNIQSYITNGDIVFDIGGNIGQYAIKFCDFVGPDGKVFSFEPDPKNFAFLQFNVNINSLKNIKCDNLGIGDKKGDLKFYRDTETGGRMGSFNQEFVKDKFSGHTELVQVETYDNIVGLYGIPNFVKIDIEGYEAKLVSAISTFHKRTIFLIEVRQSTKKEIFELFNEQGFSCKLVDFDNIIRIDSYEQIPNFANLLFHFINEH